MTEEQYREDDEFAAQPVSSTEGEVPEAAPAPRPEDAGDSGLEDLFETPDPEDNDIYTDDLFELDEEEGFGDLLTVSKEDIMGTDPRSRPGRTRVPRSSGRFGRPTPPTGGMRGVGG